MKIQSVRHIDGPNMYIYKSVMVARIDLERLAERESYEMPGFSDRLLDKFPGLREHHCAKGQPGGFVDRLYGGTYFGHVVEHVTIELACCIGLDVHFGKTLYAGGLGVYDIIMECKAFACQAYLLARAVDMVDQLIAGKEIALKGVFEQARSILASTQLGPSTQAIVDAAQRRDIPVRRLNESSLIQLGYGRKRKWLEATMTNQTSAIAVDIAGDKALTKRLLAEAGIPVPAGTVVGSSDEALQAYEEMGFSVVVKPQAGRQGRGVSLNLASAEDVTRAYELASEHSSDVIVEQYVPGRNVRALVVSGKFVAASERISARVVGDGQQTIEQLVARVNEDPRRGRGHEKPLTRILMDAVAVHTLHRQGVCPSDIPARGQMILLREGANLSTGGEAEDVTEKIHESYRVLAERAARQVGLDVAGVDMIVPDLDKPYDPQQAAVIEVNAAPGIRMHQHPSSGTSRDVADAIVQSLFPVGDHGRIPIVAVTGTNGKTTTTRLIGHALAMTGRCVGMTTTGGVFIDGRKVVGGDTTGPDSARVVLSDPVVDVAVLETARGGIVRGGLAYDKANVAVFTNITLDHVGQDGAESLDDLLHIKSLVAECVRPDGWVVLNAEDEQLVTLSKRLPTKVVFVAASDDNPALTRHLALGGVGYYVARGWVVEARGNLTWELASVQDIPLTLGGAARFQVENCLAAAAALRALGLTRQQVADAFSSFLPVRDNPGRCMLFQMPSGGHFILDYGHNPDGFEKVGAWLRRLPHRRLIGVIGVPGDRTTHWIRQGAQRLVNIFDEFILKEDEDKRGRDPGEVARVLAEEIRARQPDKPCRVVLREPDALQDAVAHLRAGDVAVMFYEKMDPLVQLLRQLGGVSVEAIDAVSEPELVHAAMR